MKLIKRTYLLSAIWLLPVLLLGSVFSFYIIEHIAYEETDEFLTYEMDRLLNYHQQNQSLPDFHKVADIIQQETYHEPFFKDTLLLEPGDNELVPHRELHFSIAHKDRYFSIVLRHLMPGKDDIIEGALLIVGGLMILVSVVLWLSINLTNRVIWKGFYETLLNLMHFRPGENVPDFPKSSIQEFEQLNRTIYTWLKKVSDDFINNKEFNENASHELQTHLAVIRSHTEKIMNEWSGSEQQFNDLQTIYQSISSLNRFQKSLLLLSKIQNLEYAQHEEVNIKSVIENLIPVYEEAAQLRNIQLAINLDTCVVKADRGLAEILVNNLLKNAVKHNIENGFINVVLTEASLSMRNSGGVEVRDSEKLFQRFYTGKSGNYGIGLAIVKQICEINNFELRYNISTENIHQVEVVFKSK